MKTKAHFKLKKTKPLNVIFYLVLVTILLRIISSNTQRIALDHLLSLLIMSVYFFLFIFWGKSIRERIMQVQTRSYLLWMTSLMIFWFFIRTLRFYVILNNLQLSRWIWYAYYIPLLLLPLLGFFVSLALAQPVGFRLSRWVYALCLPSIFLIILVLSNDLHQQVFTFSSSVFSSNDYGYAWGYGVIFSWISFLMLLTLIIILAKSSFSAKSRKIWYPFIFYGLGILYTVLYMLKLPFLLRYLPDMTAILCFLTIAIFESLIQSGLIRSNSYYLELFEVSDLPIQITNNEYQMIFESNMPISFDKVLYQRALSQPIEIKSNINLVGQPINSGNVFWLQDMSQINHLVKELQKMNDLLVQENELLIQEIALKEKQSKLDEKARLHLKIVSDVQSQLLRLEECLKQVQNKPTEVLGEMIVLGTYVKRRSNLLIVGINKNELSAKELEFSLRETIDSLTLCNISSSFMPDCQGFMNAKLAITLYDLFQEIIELTLGNLSALFVNLVIQDESLLMKCMMHLNQVNSPFDELIHLKRFRQMGGYFKVIQEDDSFLLEIGR